jgi:glycosyltransferase involved in cell wall biosynthesis
MKAKANKNNPKPCLQDKINVLHLRSSGGFFGAENVILNLAGRLNKLNYSNVIVCINNSKNPHIELLEKAKKTGLYTESVLCRKRIDFQAIFKIRELLKKHKIDILHCHDYKADLFGFLASRFLNVRLIATNHLWTKETLFLKMYEFLDGIIINLFDKVIAVSDDIAKELRKRCIFRQKLSTIYNGIDLDKYFLRPNGQKIRREFNINPETKIVGAVGRLTAQKGFEYLLEAASKILATMSKVTFLIVGEGALKEYLYKKAQELGIQDNVIFTGKRDDMVDVYRSMDVFVLPSIREGLPMAALEALAMVRPVIATNVGGVSSVIRSNETGRLLAPKDVQGLSEAIINFLNNRTEAMLMALKGKELIKENFSSEVMAHKYREVYEELMDVNIAQ